MRTLERPEHAKAWELRGHWAAHRVVVVTLTPRCVVERIEGLVSQVAVTGAFVVIDGWHVPIEDVLSIHRPHHTQRAVEVVR